VFHAVFEPGAKRGIVVSFPDVPEAITQGRLLIPQIAVAMLHSRRGPPCANGRNRYRDSPLRGVPR